MPYVRSKMSVLGDLPVDVICQCSVIFMSNHFPVSRLCLVLSGTKLGSLDSYKQYGYDAVLCNLISRASRSWLVGHSLFNRPSEHLHDIWYHYVKYLIFELISSLKECDQLSCSLHNSIHLHDVSLILSLGVMHVSSHRLLKCSKLLWMAIF